MENVLENSSRVRWCGLVVPSCCHRYGYFLSLISVWAQVIALFPTGPNFYHLTPHGWPWCRDRADLGKTVENNAPHSFEVTVVPVSSSRNAHSRDFPCCPDFYLLPPLRFLCLLLTPSVVNVLEKLHQDGRRSAGDRLVPVTWPHPGPTVLPRTIGRPGSRY